MEKIFDDYKGIIVFYVLVAIIAILFSIRMNNINSQAKNEEKVITETYYA